MDYLYLENTMYDKSPNIIWINNTTDEVNQL